jgi:glutamate/tyrosine decarboxylase-like PLP-dependent enzyme
MSTEQPQNPFTLSEAEFRKLASVCSDLASQHLFGVDQRPVFRPMEESARREILDQPLPESGQTAAELLSFFERCLLPYPMGNGHPRFFGWVNSPPAPVAVLTELLAAAMNPSCAGGDHSAIYLEHCAIRWLKELVGFPVEGSMGLLVSGGSMASLTGLATARHWAAEQRGWDVRKEGLRPEQHRLTLYMSDQAHSCVQKAMELLGLGSASIRRVDTDAELRLDADKLRSKIAEDRSNGLDPFCVVASAGTVGTGAIDPCDEIAKICREENLWLHVDGAYGAVGVLDEGLRAEYLGMERADSLALDPHKWLSVPVECGCVLVRDGDILRDAFSLVPAYLRTEPGKGFGGLPWFSEYGFQQSRGYRALKLWATLASAGRNGIADNVKNHNRLARMLREHLRNRPDMEILAPGKLSIVCFRYNPLPRNRSEEQLDRLNKAIMEHLQSSGEVFLTNANVQGRFSLRACILHYATGESDIEALVRAVAETGKRMEHDSAGHWR